MPDTRPVVAHVDAERGLPVGPGRDQPEGAAGAEDHRGEEAGRQITSLVLLGSPGRGQQHVAGQQSHHAIDVPGLVGAGEALGDRQLGSGARRRGRLLPG